MFNGPRYGIALLAIAVLIIIYGLGVSPSGLPARSRTR